MSECKCCYCIRFRQKMHQNDKEHDISSKLFAKIFTYSWRKGEKRIRGNQFSTIGSAAYNLNYCPECGRKLGGKDK